MFLRVLLFLILINIIACQAEKETPPTTHITTTDAVSEAPIKDEEVVLIETNIAKYQQIKGKYRDVQVNLPAHWKTKQNRKSGSIHAISPFDEKQPKAYKEYVIVAPMRKGAVKYDKDTKKMIPQAVDKEQFIRSHLKNLADNLPQFELVEQKDISINNKKMKQVVYNYFFEDMKYKGQLKTMMYITEHKNEIYVINLVDASTEFDQNNALFQEIIESLSFLN